MTPDQFRTIRRGLGYTQDEFAELLGISQSSLSKWERGLVPVNEDSAERARQLRRDAMLGTRRTVEHAALCGVDECDECARAWKAVRAWRVG